jgi:hypothetical protein
MNSKHLSYCKKTITPSLTKVIEEEQDGMALRTAVYSRAGRISPVTSPKPTR